MMRQVQKIWLPGAGVVDLEPLRVHRAVQEYDDRLMFGRDDVSGTWCIFVKMPHGQDPVAVLAFDELPTPEYAVRRADETNTRKHGAKIFDNMQKHNEQLRKAREADMEEADWAAAEIMEHAHRVSGTHPSPRIFVPGEVPK